MNLESLLPPVEKKRLTRFPFYGLLPVFEYRYKHSRTCASLDYLSNKPFPDPEMLDRKRKEIENLIASKLKHLLVPNKLSFGLIDYLKDMGILMWGLSARPASLWISYFKKRQSEVVVELTVAHSSESYSDDDLYIKCSFRVAKSHDDLVIPAFGIGTSCYLDDIIFSESPETFAFVSSAKNPYEKLERSLEFIKEYYDIAFFPKPPRQRQIFEGIRKRAVHVHVFEKPNL